MLYDRDAFLDRVSSLVGLALTREQRIKLPRHDDIPVLLLTGAAAWGRPRCSVGSRRHTGGAPRAYLDLAAPRHYSASEGGQAFGDAQSPLLRLLSDAVWELGLGIRHTRRVAFSRLELGLLALSLWEPGEYLTADQARALLDRARPGVGRILERGHHGDNVDEWVSEVLAELAGSVAPFPIDAFIKASVKVFTKSGAEFAHKHRDRALHWWADHRRDLPGNSYESLLITARDYHTGGAFRESAERELVASFLADLTDALGQQNTASTASGARCSCSTTSMPHQRVRASSIWSWRTGPLATAAPSTTTPGADRNRGRRAGPPVGSRPADRGHRLPTPVGVETHRGQPRHGTAGRGADPVVGPGHRAYPRPAARRPALRIPGHT
ncbi:hypothetical protein GXW82_13675 [Streptacidiphilus sp. 4-A2]|nr:hypothetical protein [Streptacidiphilus sp. 4-A2]